MPECRGKGWFPKGVGGMAVYVDDMRARFGRMVMCHMLADSTSELLGMAMKIGVSSRWIQSQGTYKEHFDISLAKRALAVRYGAIEITQRRSGELVREKRLAKD